MQLEIEPRPKGRRTKSQGFSLRPEVIDHVRRLADAYGTTMSEVVALAVMQVKPPEQKKKARK